ncbi:MAG: phosphodiester glycosidase family protein [Myxococcota bacterium]
MGLIVLLTTLAVAVGDDFTAATAHLDQGQQLSLLGQTDNVHSLADAHRHLTEKGRTPLLLTNAGIFHDINRPVGLQIEDGRTVSALNRDDGQGNFFLKPNGVFFISNTGARTVTTDEWAQTPPADVKLATQSGPMLLIDGQVHPRFRPNASSKKIRSGVCASDPNTVHLFISTVPVRFYDTAVYARDVLKCRDALYLDGTISRMWQAGEGEPPPMPFAGVLSVSVTRN